MTLRRGTLAGPRVWTWDDLWRAVRTAAGTGPIGLAPAAVGAVLEEALARCARREGLGPVAGLARTPGFRRHLLARFSAWSRAGHEPDAGAEGAEGVQAAVYAHYRRLLDRMDAADDARFARWAAAQLHQSPPWPPASVVVLEAEPGDARAREAIEAFHASAAEMLVTLPGDPACPGAFQTVAPLADRLAELGFATIRFGHAEDRPSGLSGVESALFAGAPAANPSAWEPSGLAALGGPQGEGCSLLIARRVRDQLRAGGRPEEVVVVVPRWSEGAELIVETLRSWDIPARGLRGRPLACHAGISALLLAAGLPARRWEAARLARLLRNSRLRPAWLDERSAGAAPAAARAVEEVRAFRDLDAIRRALARQADRSAAEGARTEHDRRRRLRRADRAEQALRLLEPLAALLQACHAPGTWDDHLDRLRWVADELGLFDPDERAFDGLAEALEDWGAARERLDRSDRPLEWPEFLEIARRLARETAAPPEPPLAGQVVVACLPDALGATADHLILAGLDEGTFPARDAVRLDADSEAASAAYAGEMLRFLRVIGSARRSLTLVFPTADEHGQALLPAGFLDDLRRCLGPARWAAIARESSRLDPVLPDDLAGSRPERRVRAVALASRGDAAGLTGLILDRRERAILDGTAAALHVAARRGDRRGRFTPFEGHLNDRGAAQRVVELFGPGRFLLSASQLESLAFCPFQFFLRYVARVEPNDDRDELEEDRAARGSLIHRALEELHRAFYAGSDGSPAPLADRVAAELPGVIARLLEADARPQTEIERGLHAIQAGRLQRAGRRYAEQFRAYEQGPGKGACCRFFEESFGLPSTPDRPPLEIGRPDSGVLLYGTIDRIDLVPLDGGAGFRVIDYKTGPAPSRGDIDGGLALQLPLYALAAQSLIAGAEGAQPLDAGYWGIAGKGYRATTTMAAIRDGGAAPDPRWEATREALDRYVADLIARVRAADFPVAPRREDCTRACDYKVVCRITQVRRAEKRWDDAPRLRVEG